MLNSFICMYPKPNLIIPKTAFAARGFGRRKNRPRIWYMLLSSLTACYKCHYNQVMTLIHVLPKGLIILLSNFRKSSTLFPLSYISSWMPFPSMKIVVLYCLVVNCNNPFSVSHLGSKWKEVEQIAGDFWIDKMLSNGNIANNSLSLYNFIVHLHQQK